MEVANSRESAAFEVLRTEVLREDDLRIRALLMDISRFHDDSGSLRDEEQFGLLVLDVQLRRRLPPVPARLLRGSAAE